MAEVLAIIMAVFAVIGALDKITGNHLKLGDEFEKGILTLGPLSLSMIGMMTIAPALSDLLLPVITPVANLLHFDPSALAGILIANDMGGAALADGVATDPLLGSFHGLCVASMLGATVSFTIPVALRSSKKENHDDVLLGLLCGIATIPVGCFISGLVMGINPLTVLLNLSPALLISVIIILGLLFLRKITVKIFSIFGKLITILITAGLALGIFQQLTGKAILKNTAPIMESAATVFTICITLAGTFPLIAIISKILKKPLSALGKKFDLDDTSVVGLIATLANSIATMESADRMNRKGRVLNLAFAVSAAFVFGDHLAFTLSYNDEHIIPVIVGKLVAGITALVLASILYKKTNK
ncbi:MAG: ethanolamine utilization protein EutH [Ruminococcaceae bacterium]|nr:ethanolamine utilization protein EutH [Oscillospiraceae bacterium]